MALKGMSQGELKKTQAEQPKHRVDAFLEALNREWDYLEAEKETGLDGLTDQERALRIYFNANIRPSLMWVQGDPVRMKFPDEYLESGARLPKLCAFLKKLDKSEDLKHIQDTRERQLLKLRDVWPRYAAQYLEFDEEFKEYRYTWDALTNLWTPLSDSILLCPDSRIRLTDGNVYVLPRFEHALVEEWHMVCLAVLWCNKLCKIALTDLSPHSWGRPQPRSV